MFLVIKNCENLINIGLLLFIRNLITINFLD